MYALRVVKRRLDRMALSCSVPTTPPELAHKLAALLGGAGCDDSHGSALRLLDLRSCSPGAEYAATRQTAESGRLAKFG